jgi:glutathione S-transferase
VIRALDVASSIASTLVRLAAGAYVGELGPRPEKRLQLYDFEGCPFCRKAREALSILDLEVEVYPCPKGGTRYRRELRARGGKEQFPYLVDPNTGQEMYESSDIVDYLFERYGTGSVPWVFSGGPLVDLAASIGTAVRGGRGIWVQANRAPEKLLELWSYEASPFSRLAREALCSLEIPYVLHNVARGSPSREAFVARSGRMMVPYLADPNTGTEMFESADIVRYLKGTYGETD